MAIWTEARLIGWPSFIEGSITVANGGKIKQRTDNKSPALFSCGWENPFK
jgi:hypothetical protein